MRIQLTKPRGYFNKLGLGQNSDKIRNIRNIEETGSQPSLKPYN